MTNVETDTLALLFIFILVVAGGFLLVGYRLIDLYAILKRRPITPVELEKMVSHMSKDMDLLFQQLEDTNIDLAALSYGVPPWAIRKAIAHLDHAEVGTSAWREAFQDEIFLLKTRENMKAQGWRIP